MVYKKGEDFVKGKLLEEVLKLPELATIKTEPGLTIKTEPGEGPQQPGPSQSVADASQLPTLPSLDDDIPGMGKFYLLKKSM